jgi:hypothetical protein
LECEGNRRPDAFSLSQTQSGWRLIENWTMLLPDVGFVQTTFGMVIDLPRSRVALEEEILVLRQ